MDDLEYFDIFESRGSGQYPKNLPFEEFITNAGAETSFSDKIDLAKDPVVYKSVRVEENPESYEQPYTDGDIQGEIAMEFVQEAEKSLRNIIIGEKQDDVIGKGAREEPPFDNNEGFQAKGQADIPPDEEGKDLYGGDGDQGAFKDGNGMNYQNGEPGDEKPGEDVTKDGGVANKVGIPFALIGLAAAAYFIFFKK